MAKFTPIKVAFNTGELSPLMQGRVDIDKYGIGCQEMTNFIPLVQGPAMRRPGTRYINDVKDSSNRVWLQSFVFNYQQSFILEFGPQYIRFYNNYNYVSCGSPAAYFPFTTYSVGDLVSYSGVNYYCVQEALNKTPNTNPAYWHALVNDIYEIETPYTADDLTTDEGTFGLSLVQSGDVIYIAQRNHPVGKLSRFSNTRWIYSEVDFKNGPFETNNTDQDIIVTADGLVVYNNTNFVEYTVDLIATGGDVFDSSMVGTLMLLEVTNEDGAVTHIKPWQPGKVVAFGDQSSNDGKYYAVNATTGSNTTGSAGPIHTSGGRFDGEEISWWYLADQRGIIRIDSVIDSVTATGTVIKQVQPVTTSDTMETWAWSKYAWRSDVGYPSHVAFFRDRLVFGRDQKLWFSCAGDYENFAAKEFGEVLTDSAISITVPFDQISQLTYLTSTKTGLVVGSTDGEALVIAGIQGEPFGPTNIRVDVTTYYGARKMKPAKVDNVILFAQRTGRKLREQVYDFNTDNLLANDVTILAEHITQSGIVDMTFHREPYNVLWCALANGYLLGFTYNRAQNVTGWHRHKLGGDYQDSGYGIVESVQVIPSYDGSRDDLWLVVKRTINGQTKRFIEYLDKGYMDGEAQSSCFYLDAGKSINQSSSTTVTGLNYLEGQEVGLLTNGAIHVNKTVSSGQVTLDIASTIIQVGLPFTPILTTMKIEGGSQQGTAQGKKKKITEVMLRLYNSGGVQVGTGLGSYPYTDVTQRNTNTPMGTPEPLITDDVRVSIDSPITQAGTLTVTSDEHLPITVIALSPTVEVYEP